MAQVASSRASPALPADLQATGFEAHILSLLANINRQSSTSFPFPVITSPGGAGGVPSQTEPAPPRYAGKKTAVQEAIENGILVLGERIRATERISPGLGTASAGATAQTALPTPDETPPGDLPINAVVTQARLSPNPAGPIAVPTICPKCLQSSMGDTTPGGATSAPARNGPSGSAPAAAPGTVMGHLLGRRSGLFGIGQSGAWGDIKVRGDEMNAEKELELLKAQVQDIARVCKVSHPYQCESRLTRQAVATGDLTQKIVVPVEGPSMTELKDIINTMVDRLNTFATEVERVSLEVGTQGKLGGQAVVEGVEGTWRNLTTTVNTLAANLTTQVRSIAKVTKVRRLYLVIPWNVADLLRPWPRVT